MSIYIVQQTSRRPEDKLAMISSHARQAELFAGTTLSSSAYLFETPRALSRFHGADLAWRLWSPAMVDWVLWPKGKAWIGHIDLDNGRHPVRLRPILQLQANVDACRCRPRDAMGQYPAVISKQDETG